MHPKPVCVLLVDDDKDDLMLFSVALKMADPQSTLLYAEHGEAALELLRGHGATLPDFIFLDLNMPRMNGKECLKELKKSKDLRSLPVIIYTTSKRDSDVSETRELGASCFVTKPMNFHEMVEVIKFILTEKPVSGEYLKQLVEVF